MSQPLIDPRTPPKCNSAKSVLLHLTLQKILTQGVVSAVPGNPYMCSLHVICGGIGMTFCLWGPGVVM